jgi:enoyl-CoA hydratase/carnithine racemase
MAGEGPAPTANVTAALASLDRVLIAAIDGDCLSAGLELALACDIRLATPRSRFGFPEVSLGTIPSGGGTQRLPRIVGRAAALELLLLAEPIDAMEAFRIGLVNRVVNDLGPALKEVTDLLLSRGPLGLRYAKEAISKGLDMMLDQGLRLEGDLNFLLQTTADRAEGVRAFLEKRQPQFKGR